MTPEEIETFLSSPTGAEVADELAMFFQGWLTTTEGKQWTLYEAAEHALKLLLSHRVGTPCLTCDGYDYESDVVTYQKHPVGEPPEPCPVCAGSGVVNQEPALIPRSALVQVGRTLSDTERRLRESLEAQAARLDDEGHLDNFDRERRASNLRVLRSRPVYRLEGPA